MDWDLWRLQRTHTLLVYIPRYSESFAGTDRTGIVCGPPRYSEIRINLAQAFNAVGTVIAPVLGSYAFFKNVGNDEASLQNVQWVYLAIACFVFLLAFVFYFSTIPEITDADMGFQVGGPPRMVSGAANRRLSMSRFRRLTLEWMRSLFGSNTGLFLTLGSRRHPC